MIRLKPEIMLKPGIMLENRDNQDYVETWIILENKDIQEYLGYVETQR